MELVVVKLMVDEKWLPVTDYEGMYEVSDQGRVRSLDRFIRFPNGRGRTAPGQMLKPWVTPAGYQMVKINGGKRYVHHLIAEAFISPRPEGLLVCHGDSDSQNNVASNLRYGTYSDNEYDKVAAGSHQQASKTNCPSGHAYDEENTIHYTARGYNERLCRACQRQHSRNSKAKKRLTA